MKSERRTLKPMATSLAISLVTAVVILFVALLVFLFHVAAGRFLDTQPTATIIAAVVGVVGAFVTALLSVLGVLLKHSIDTRAEMRLEVEAARNASLQREAENRLQLQAAISATQLLGTSNGTASAPVQRAGALFALVSLGQYDLTTALVESLLSTSEIESATASRLLNEVLMRASVATQEQAISVLNHHADRMVTNHGFDLPDCIMEGCAGLPDYVRDWAPVVISKVLLARPFSEWQNRQGQLLAAVGAVALAWSFETDVRIKTETGAILRSLLSVVDTGRRPILLGARSGAVDISKVRAQVATVTAGSDVTEAILSQIARWAAK